MEKKVLEILEELCNDSIVKEDINTELFKSGLLDSLAFAELLFTIEEEFNVIISPSEIAREDIDTPFKIIEQIRAKM